MPEHSSGKKVIVRRARSPVRGALHLSGDKSVSIRRALMSLWFDDDIVLDNFGRGEDCQTALLCLKALGKRVVQTDRRVLLSGPAGLNSVALNCRNSGTTARLLMSLLADRVGGNFWFFGDDSLSRRPMERIAAPLRKMGAEISLNHGCLPAELHGHSLRAIELDSAISSAQVKSAVLFAGAKADGVTRYREPFPSRDHTERLLGLHADSEGWIECDPTRISISSRTLSGEIPSDISSAGFWGVAAALIPESEVSFHSVLANPLRTAWTKKLVMAGASVLLSNESIVCGEFVSDLAVRHRQLKGFDIPENEVPLLIDEIPILAIAAAVAEGESRFQGLSELRLKESDRLKLIADNLTRMNARVESTEDGLCIDGSESLKGAHIETHGDHRMAMAFAIAGLVADGETVIHDADCVAVSYPEFWSDLKLILPDSIVYDS